MDIFNQSFYLVTNGGFPLIRVPGGTVPPPHTHTHLCAKLLIIKHSHSITPPPHTHTHTHTHTHLCAKLLIIKHVFVGGGGEEGREG